MKKIVAIAAMAFALAACGTPEASEDRTTEGSPAGVFVQEMPDGTEVACIYIDGYKEAGLSCDFEGAQ